MDYVFSGSDYDMALDIQKQFDEILKLAQENTSEVLYGLEDENGNYQAVTMSVRRGGGVDYLHPIICRKGKNAHLVFGWDGIAPTVKLVDDAGKGFIDPVGKNIEIPFVSRASVNKLASFDSSKLLTLGLEVAAIAFGIWLGAKILGMAIAALAFVAFNALLIGIILSATGALGPAAEWALDKFGFTIEEVKSYFNAGLDTLVEFVRRLAEAIHGGYSVS